jgi:hypothetical protein
LFLCCTIKTSVLTDQEKSSFEPLKLRLIDRTGHPVAESIQTTVVQAFERAVAIPDANIHDLVLGAARVARVIADGGAQRPEEYASSVLRRIAWQSQRNFLEQPGTCPLVEDDEDIEAIEEEFNGPSAIQARIGIRQLLEGLNEQDQKIVLMRSRGFRYEEIAQEVGMLLVSVRCRYHLAKKRLQKLAADKR